MRHHKHLPLAPSLPLHDVDTLHLLGGVAIPGVVLVIIIVWVGEAVNVALTAQARLTSTSVCAEKRKKKITVRKTMEDRKSK